MAHQEAEDSSGPPRGAKGTYIGIFWEELCAVFGVLKRRIGECEEVVAVLGCKYFRVMFVKQQKLS